MSLFLNSEYTIIVLYTVYTEQKLSDQSRSKYLVYQNCLRPVLLQRILSYYLQEALPH